MFLKEYYVAFKQICLIIALHLRFNCVFVYLCICTHVRAHELHVDMGTLKEWNRLIIGKSRGSPERAWGTWHSAPHPNQKEKIRPGLVGQWLSPPTLTPKVTCIDHPPPVAAARKRCPKTQSKPTFCSGAAFNDNSIALFINCDTKTFSFSH